MQIQGLFTKIGKNFEHYTKFSKKTPCNGGYHYFDVCLVKLKVSTRAQGKLSEYLKPSLPY